MKEKLNYYLRVNKKGKIEDDKFKEVIDDFLKKEQVGEIDLTIHIVDEDGYSDRKVDFIVNYYIREILLRINKNDTSKPNKYKSNYQKISDFILNILS